MPHASSFRRPRIGSGQRRKMTWGVGPRQVPLDLTAAGATLWSLGSQSLLNDTTVTRIRGELSMVLSVVTTIGDGFDRVAVGICNVTENAFNAGVTAVPAPIGDVGWDGWIWHRWFASFRGASVTELGVSPMEAVRVEIDSKAMRKVHQTDFLIGVVELGAETGAATLQFSAETRVLDKLP